MKKLYQILYSEFIFKIYILFIKKDNFIFSKKNILSNFKIKIKGKNNTVDLGSCGKYKNLAIKIKGNNNKIILGNNVAIPEGAFLEIWGNDSSISLGNNGKLGKAFFLFLKKSDNHFISGDKTTFEEFLKVQLSDGTTLKIGDDCMFSFNIRIDTTDHHSIFDKISKKRTNFPENIEFGNHVWVCPDCVILKGTKVSSNSIVATRTVLTKKFLDNNIIIGGIPAKILKKDIDWTR